MTLTDVEFANKKNIRKFDLLEKIDNWKELWVDGINCINIRAWAGCV